MSSSASCSIACDQSLLDVSHGMPSFSGALSRPRCPAGFEQMVAEVNRSELGRRNGGNVLSAQASERALLINLLARLRTLDADVYVGHNISAFDLDVLLHRLQFHKVLDHPCPPRRFKPFA